MTSLASVLFESITVGDDTRWVITKNPDDTFCVRRITKGKEDDRQTGIKTLAGAKDIVERKLTMWRVFDESNKKRLKRQ